MDNITVDELKEAINLGFVEPYDDKKFEIYIMETGFVLEKSSGSPFTIFLKKDFKIILHIENYSLSEELWLLAEKRASTCKIEKINREKKAAINSFKRNLADLKERAQSENL